MQTFETLEDSAVLVQLQLTVVAQQMLALIETLMPWLTAVQCDAIRTGMRSEADVPTCLVELRWSGVRCTLVHYVDGQPVVLDEHTSPPVPIPTADSVRQGAPL